MKWGRLPKWPTGKESAGQCRRCKRHMFDPWVRKIPWSRKWHPTPITLPGKFHGQRSLASNSPRGCRVIHDWVTEQTWNDVSPWDTILYLCKSYLFIRRVESIGLKRKPGIFLEGRAERLPDSLSFQTLPSSPIEIWAVSQSLMNILLFYF